MGLLAKISAVAEISVFIRRHMVGPLPDTAPDHIRMPLKDFPVIHHISGAVAHRVAVLAKKHGPVVSGLLMVCHHLCWRPVHPADHIHSIRVFFHRVVAVRVLIMHQPADTLSLTFPLSDIPAHGRKIFPVIALISQTEHYHAGTVLVPFIKPGRPVRKSFLPGFVAGRPDGIRVICPSGVSGGESMGFQIRFVYHIESQFLTQLDEGGLRRVMGGTDGIDVQFLHAQKLFPHFFISQDIPVVTVGIVVVDALQLHADAIDQKLSLLRNFLVAQADFYGDEFSCFLYNHGVQVRLFCVPENRICQFCLFSLRVKYPIAAIVVNPLGIKADVDVKEMSLGPA